MNLPALLILLFTAVPLLELALLLRVGRLIGVGPTLALVILTGVTGALLARGQGVATLRRIQADLAGGIMPGDRLLDGLFILAGGLLLLTPGLLTDALGFCALLPPGRALLKRVLTRRWRLRLDHDIEPPS